MPIKKVKKQKQKQKQQQSVVVNVNTGRRATRRGPPRKARSGGGGGGTSFIPYPVYTNAPTDYAPIIHNLPAQYQNQPALSMPVQALANIPTANIPSAVAVEAFPIPTQLQTVREDNRPLVSAIKSSSFIEELKRAQGKRGASRLGTSVIGSNIKKPASTPFQEALEQSINTRSLRQSPAQFTSEVPTGLISPISMRSSPGSAFQGVNPMIERLPELKGLGEEQLKARKKEYDANRYKNKKMGPG